MITHDVDEAVLLSDSIVMMTNGPEATVGEVLRIELDRPRDRLQLADDPQYNHYRAQVLKFLYERQRNPLKQDTDVSSPDEANVAKFSQEDAA
jgi:nitrate/nitrite transport system ATP-binding protein